MLRNLTPRLTDCSLPTKGGRQFSVHSLNDHDSGDFCSVTCPYFSFISTIAVVFAEDQKQPKAVANLAAPSGLTNERKKNVLIQPKIIRSPFCPPHAQVARDGRCIVRLELLHRPVRWALGAVAAAVIGCPGNNRNNLTFRSLTVSFRLCR